MDGRLKEVVIIVARIGAGPSGVANPARWNVQTGSEAHPASNSMGTGVPCRGQNGHGVKLTTTSI